MGSRGALVLLLAVAPYRELKGKVKDFEQLTKVPGVNVEKLWAKRAQIAFSL